jgi:nitrile hydratase accessory protein
MTDAVDRGVANMQGPAALPRKNGELVFESPWQARVFGMAVALSDQGRYGWDDFRERLIVAIAAADHNDHDESPATIYYEQWLAAFEQLLLAQGFCTRDEIERRTAEFASGQREEVY